MRYDEETGLYVGMPQILPMPAPKTPEQTRAEKIAWALAYLRAKFPSR
jgi:hypothetical protein